MICPYLKGSITKYTNWTQQPNDEQTHLVNGSTVEQTIITQPICLKENCGAWHDGKCNYNR